MHAARLDAATMAFRRAIEIAPERAAGWVNLAVALETTRHFDAAHEAARTAIDRDPSSVLAWLALARIETARGRKSAALGVLRMARSLGLDDERLKELERQAERQE